MKGRSKQSCRAVIYSVRASHSSRKEGRRDGGGAHGAGPNFAHTTRKGPRTTGGPFAGILLAGYKKEPAIAPMGPASTVVPGGHAGQCRRIITLAGEI